MPELITQRYELTGWETVVIYSEQEMADVLDLVVHPIINLECKIETRLDEHDSSGYQ